MSIWYVIENVTGTDKALNGCDLSDISMVVFLQYDYYVSL